MQLKRHEYTTLENKLKLKTREGRDRLSWFEHEGKVITRTKRSRGKSDLPHADAIRQQLKLNEDELRDFLRCKLYRDDYVKILTAKGLIESRD